MRGFGRGITEDFDFKGKEISIVYGDITTITADAIVSSDDNYLSMGGGVSAAILRAGGEAIWNESRDHVPIKMGSAIATSAGHLKAKYVIHAAVIDWDERQWPDVEIVRNATSSCLAEADRLGCEVVAIPALGTGTGQLASESAATAMIDSILSSIGEKMHIRRIIVVLNRQDTLLDFIRLSIEERIRNEFESKLEALQQEKDRLVAELRAKSPYSNLPFPIAITRKLVDSHNTYHSKFTSSIECMESVVKYLSSIALAEYMRTHPETKADLTKFFNKDASLGSWKEQLERTLKELDETQTHPIISTIRSIYFSPNRGRIAEMIKMRNEYYGHGATLPDNAYEPHYRRLIEALDHIFLDLHRLSHFPLILVLQTNVLDDCFEYDVIEIIGDNIIFPKKSLRCNSLRLSRGIVYVLDDANEHALPLSPFLVFETCPYCNVQETFFLENCSDSGATYHTYRANHRIQTRNYSHYFLHT